ncbi:MAG: tRNA (adenosine(37)-N6)-dimethylallyltransferase MiaA [Chthoniobacteraceae bacterium]
MPRISRERDGVPDATSSAPFFLLGPTAVGKSALAVEFAERVGGEIIGADAFQVYAGLDVLSAKPSAELRARVPHHLVGEVPLTAHFDVAQWLARARECVAEITARGLVPIVCGGAGLYVRALTHGLAPLPGADAALRALLEKEPLPVLAERLLSLDPASAVDMRNPRRVIRALEVCILTGRPFSSFRSEWSGDAAPRGFILSRSREELHAAIQARTVAMFAAGVIEEVARTGEISATAAQMLGLAEIRQHIAGSLTREQCIEAIALATRQYAKRQLTWFRRERAFAWIDLSSMPDPLGELLAAFAR